MARDSYLLRIDPKVMAALRKWSEDEVRSVNAQIEYLLRSALRNAGRLPTPIESETPDCEKEKPSPKKASE